MKTEDLNMLTIKNKYCRRVTRINVLNETARKSVKRCDILPALKKRQKPLKVKQITKDENEMPQQITPHIQ